MRLVNIFSGRDSSGKGRTSDAFFLANKLLEKKDEYWGVGFGQIKIIGSDVIRHYYMYGENFVATIPNAVAETYTILGWTGVTLRMFVEVFFFFKPGSGQITTGFGFSYSYLYFSLREAT